MVDLPPGEQQPPKKSSPVKWILMGCGCITLVGILIVGGLAYMGYRMVAKMNDAASEYVKSQPEVEKEIGAVQKVELDISGGTQVSQKNESGAGLIVYKVTGARGSGTAKVWMTYDGQWRGQAMIFTAGEKTIRIGNPPAEGAPTKNPD